MKTIDRIVFLLITAFTITGFENRADATVGATIPFTSFEGESGSLGGGAVVRSMGDPPADDLITPELEASGRAFVELKGTGQSVSWKNTTQQSFTAMNLRFSIPATPENTGTVATLNLYVDGKFRQNINLSSAQSWTGLSHNPAPNRPHKYFDDTHFWIAGAPVAPGSTITLQQDADNTAAFYWIDVVDLEAPPPALTQSENSLSITAYGAVADDKTVDSTDAIQHCLDDAEAQEKTAWIPSGTFYMNGAKGLHAKGIVIAGAGMWYSTIYRNAPLPMTEHMPDIIQPVSCTLKNFCLDANATSRKSIDGDSGAINIKGEKWLVDSVWVQHTASGVWGDGTDGVVENCRMLSTYGDGINLNNGNSGHTGDNLTAQNNYVRGTGDDGLAINSDISSNQMHHITLINNTSIAPWWANGIGIYGGVDILVQDNLIYDDVTENGLSISVFGNTGAALESGVVQGNLVVRSGNARHAGLTIGTRNEHYSIANVYVGSNTVKSSPYRGIVVDKGTNIVIQNNNVDAATLDGIVIEPIAAGSGIWNGNTVTNGKEGHTDVVQSTDNYAMIKPIPAAGTNDMSAGSTTESCSEGGQALTNINDGSSTSYDNVNLDGMNNFDARVSSRGPGGTISIYLDNSSGTLLGTCTVDHVDGGQPWVTATCPLTGASGKHTICLVYHGAGKNLFDLEWIAFFP